MKVKIHFRKRVIKDVVVLFSLGLGRGWVSVLVDGKGSLGEEK